ncbi:MAG: hypothetical protein A3E19_02685 [Planctomycetes bacterium RIFCSPHIGHO2_12_FULL_52_36]|nr:MAG: hypothetical protein A3E19_02685 [Planctomycetes bacterium RIFCSPHIGHO2_12_FULL_52_36]
MKIFTINVGANASHANSGLKSPIFPDNKFEFIPIDCDYYKSSEFITYKELHSFNKTENKLTKYMPENWWDKKVHNDPDWENMTYGDFCNDKSRAARLKEVGKGDFLLFWSRLYKWDEGFVDKGNLCLIGFIKVEDVFKIEEGKISNGEEVFRKDRINKIPEQLRKNAHVQAWIRGEDKNFWDGAWIFVGSKKNSIRFKKAVMLEWDWATKVFQDKEGNSWKRASNKGTEQQRIGSYLRACRCQLDSNTKEDGERLKELLKKIRKLNDVGPLQKSLQHPLSF